MKKILFTILFILPLILYAHGSEYLGLAYSTFCYFLLGGLIIGLIELLIFEYLLHLIVKLSKVVLYNYLILIPAYIISYFMVNYLTQCYGLAGLWITIIIYFGIIVGIKYIVYKKYIFKDKKGLTKKFILIIFSNFIMLGFYLYLVFGTIKWFFID